MGWEAMLAVIFGFISQGLADLLGKRWLDLPAQTRSMLNAVLAIVLYSAAWKFVPDLQSLPYEQIFWWGAAAAGIGSFVKSGRTARTKGVSNRR